MNINLLTDILKRKIKTLLSGVSLRKRAYKFNFDPAFYKAFYRDLEVFRDDNELYSHFTKHGRAEGRFPNQACLDQAKLGVAHLLPADFDPSIYRLSNRDLAFISNDWDLIQHWLAKGQHERREYKFDLEKYETEFAAIRNLNTDLNQYNSFFDLLKKNGLSPGAWLVNFDFAAFSALSDDWLPHPVKSRTEGLCFFVLRGIERLTPISLSLPFDPGYVRAHNPRDGAARTDSDLYREWLSVGFERGDAASEHQFLSDLLGQPAFPTCFDEFAYRKSALLRKQKVPAGRDRALEHFIKVGFADESQYQLKGLGADILYNCIGEYHLNNRQPALADKAYASAISIRYDNPHSHHRRGDALRLLEMHEEAFAEYLAAANLPDSGVWSHIHAAEGLVVRGDHLGAGDQLLRSAPVFIGSAPWRKAARAIVDATFEAEMARAAALYLSGNRNDADRQIDALLDRIETLIHAVNKLPPKIDIANEGPIVIIANRDLPQCDHYRVTQKYEYLLAGGWSVEIYDQLHTDAYCPALNRARAVIFYRTAARPAIIEAILYLRALGIPTFYEIDDLIFDPANYPDPYDTYENLVTRSEYVGLQIGVPLFRGAMRLCDEGIASTQGIADAMAPVVRTGRVHVLRNGLDSRIAPFIDKPWQPLGPDAVTIFYGSGTKAHSRDFSDLLTPALLHALATHANVRLVLVGFVPLDKRFNPYLSRIHRASFDSDLQCYWETLSGADINLAVLARTSATDAKSTIKWLEAAACGVPSIVSATRAYQDELSDGEDVLLATNVDDWSRHLERLITDSAFRRRIGEAARRKALVEYSGERATAILRRFLPKAESLYVQRDSLKLSNISAPARLPINRSTKFRILIVNVFFPPQTTGGATRVVHDNVDFLIDNCADEFDVAVATSDDRATPPYLASYYDYRGVPVWRLSTPIEHDMDWRPFNPSITGLFETMLDRLAPDLVHFHCIQRLSASVVASVQDRAIPHLVTFHDAWWISDLQFLVDGDGQLRLPDKDSLRTGATEGRGLLASVARRRRLTRLLDGANALVTVSESFAEIYRRAGFGRTISIANGVSALPMARRTRSSSGRTRLGQIGGRTVHKGANLIEAVLRTGRFSNVELVIVDNSLEPSEVRYDRWGTTSVEIIGRVAQDNIMALYGRLDVLLAPSVWPESYGLVTREARVAGLWVVASDCGAIGEDIKPGIDGFVIDVSTTAGLRDAISAIDADPDRFQASPPPSCFRRSDDQGAALATLYRRLLTARPTTNAR